MPMTIALCDDDKNQIKSLKNMLREWNNSIILSEYNSAEQFLFSYPDTPCDLLLLDIEMDGMNGVELAKELRDKGDMLPIIFITGFSEYIGDGYDVEALHYLIKPVDKNKLFQVLDRYARRHRPADRIILPSSDESMLVSSDDIIYLEAFGKKTQITLHDGKEIISTWGLGTVAKTLGNGFVPCHRSYIINIGYVNSISKTEVTMDDGKKLPLSRRLYHSVNRAFIDFYKENEE